MTMDSSDYLLRELRILEDEHQNLEYTPYDIRSLDDLTIQRIKRRKLWIKDRIAAIKSVVYPEVIA